MIKYLRKMGPKGNKLNLKLVTTTTDVMCDSEKPNEIEKGKILLSNSV